MEDEDDEEERSAEDRHIHPRKEVITEKVGFMRLMDDEKPINTFSWVSMSIYIGENTRLGRGMPLSQIIRKWIPSQPSQGQILFFCNRST